MLEKVTTIEPSENACSKARVATTVKRRPGASPLLFGKYLWSNTQILETGLLWNLDLAPDSKRFAVFPRPEATGEQKGSVHVTVLLNFFDELRRRVPAGQPERP